MENKRKTTKIKITNNEKDFLKYASRRTYISHKTIGKNLVVRHKKKQILTLDKPLYVGVTVLELSKLAMYKFYCVFVKKKCENPKLLNTDTDSFILETGVNFYEIMLDHKELFDLNNFPKDSKYFCNHNKKLPGKMTDEYGGTALYEFIGTKSKIYSMWDKNNCEKSVYKGHSSNIEHDEFMNTLINKKFIRHNMSGIKSFNHKMFTYESNEISLSAYDDKRYILDDGIHTLAYGHKNIIKN